MIARSGHVTVPLGSRPSLSDPLSMAFARRPRPLAHRSATGFGVAMRLLIAALAISARPAMAQSGGANEWALDSSLAQHMNSGPKPGTWAAQGMAGAQFLSGRTDSRGYDTDLIIAHTTKRRMVLRLDAEWRRVDARLRTGEKMTVLDDTRFLAVSAIHRLGERTGLMLSGVWRQDERAGLEGRTMAQIGPAWQVVASPRLQLSVLPFIGLGEQRDAKTSDGRSLEAFGGTTSLTWRATPTARVELWTSGHRVFGEPADHAWQANASVTAALSKHLGLKVAYNVAHEGVVATGQNAKQHSVTTGLTIVFPRLGAAGSEER